MAVFSNKISVLRVLARIAKFIYCLNEAFEKKNSQFGKIPHLIERGEIHL
jgi:hypothetical protein